MNLADALNLQRAIIFSLCKAGGIKTSEMVKRLQNVFW